MQKKINKWIVIILEALLISGITLFSVLPVSCQVNESGIHVLGGDYVPPKLEKIVVTDSRTLRLVFSEKVILSSKVINRVGFSDRGSEERTENGSDIGSEVGSGVNTEVDADVVYSEDNTIVDISFSDDMTIGCDYRMTGFVKDEVGNSTVFMIPFTGFNSRIPCVVMTEIQTESVSSQTTTEKNNGFYRNEYVEFFVLSDGNLSGLVFESAYDGIERSFKFPAIDVRQGEVFILHLRNRGNGCVSEIGEDLNAATNSYSVAGVRDLWVTSTETALGNKTDVLLVKNSFNGQVLDCVRYRESKITEWDKKYVDSVRESEDSGIYDSSDIEDSVLTDGMSGTKVLLRRISADLLNVVLNGGSFGYPLKQNNQEWTIGASSPGVFNN